MKSKEEIAWEFERGAKIIKAALEMAMRRLDSMKEEEKEEGTVMLKLAYFSRTIQQAELYNVGGGTLYIREKMNREEVCGAISTITAGPLAGKAFVLNTNYDWELGRDTESLLCLVPIKKQKEEEDGK